jgi:hypothetical protein
MSCWRFIDFIVMEYAGVQAVVCNCVGGLLRRGSLVRFLPPSPFPQQSAVGKPNQITVRLDK